MTEKDVNEGKSISIRSIYFFASIISILNSPIYLIYTKLLLPHFRIRLLLPHGIERTEKLVLSSTLADRTKSGATSRVRGSWA